MPTGPPPSDGGTSHLLSPVARKLAPIVALFVAIVLCLVCLVHAEMEIMAGVRAYVRGEGLWSKGQKDAVLALQRYAATHQDADWAAYHHAIAVPLGDHQALLELGKPDPNLAIAYEGFLRGGNHEEDLPRLAMLFRRFGRIAYMRDAIAFWRAADAGILQLGHEAAALRATIVHGPDPAAIAPILVRIAALNDRLTGSRTRSRTRSARVPASSTACSAA